MNTAPSRREKRETRFYALAEKGVFSCSASLFKSEAETLIKKGFDVTRNSTAEKNSSPANISWEFAFDNDVPYIVVRYIVGDIQTFPKHSVKTWAQELYVIAARARYLNSSTNK